MTAVSVRAPGKAIVCGEYAVLDGAPAISVAVDRYAIARLGAGQRSPFVGAALSHAARALGDASLASLGVSVDSSGLYEAGGKIGLGSSAAVTAAVVGLAFVHAGAGLEDRARLFRIADAAHAEAQGVQGSGIDVATSVYGGAIRFQRAPGTAPAITPISWPAALRLAFVYSGQSASTPELVGKVRRLRERDAARYGACMGVLASLAERFAASIAAGDAAEAVRVVGLWTPALAELGNAADAPIVTPFFASLAATAASHGAAAKPSGAGGGDLGVIIGLDDNAPLRHSLSRDGIQDLDLVPAGPVSGLAMENA